MPVVLPLPARVYAQASVVKTLVALIQEPTPERTLALESHLTKLATAADVERYLASMRACAATARMLDERYLPPAYTLDDLERCAPGTLGHVYRRHMIEQDLRPDFFAPIDPSDDFAYSRLRLYMTHDLWHVVRPRLWQPRLWLRQVRLNGSAPRDCTGGQRSRRPRDHPLSRWHGYGLAGRADR